MRLKVLSRFGLTYSAQTNFEIMSGCYTFAATVVSKNSISSWLKKYKEEGKESLLKNNRGNKKLKMTRLKKINDKKIIKKEETPEEKIERLEIINAYLTEENELLKKKLLTKQQRAKE